MVGQNGDGPAWRIGIRIERWTEWIDIQTMASTRSRDSLTTGMLRALVVEDDVSWQQILSEILADEGLEVDVAEDLDNAVRYLRSMPHRIAVVDLSLDSGEHGNEDGLRVLEQVRRRDPGCVTIMLTGFATVELAVSALSDYGAFTCLRKEAFRRAEFRCVLAQALASAPVLAPDASSGPARLDSAKIEPRLEGAMEPSPRLALVVEDDASWRSILSELLTDEGYEVHVSAGYGEALGTLRRERYAVAVVDLVLSTLPGHGRNSGVSSAESPEGYRLLDTARTLGLPTVVVSGTTVPDEIERAFEEYGVSAFISKQTFDRRAFAQAVAQTGELHRRNSELADLTSREFEVLELLAHGMTNKEIAETLVITTNTVKRHLKAIFGKLDVHTRAAAAAKAISEGIPIQDGMS